MAHEQSELELIDQLVESFMRRYRNGEKPSIEEYAALHPRIADKIRRLFPTLLAVEDLVPATPESRESPLDGSVGPPVFERLGEYRIKGEIGRGGMGVVYEAIQESLDRRVALKVIPSRGPDDSRRLERFQREARAAAGLHHTNIVPVYDVGHDGGFHYYAMQFIDGIGLEEWLADHRRTAPIDRSGSSRSNCSFCGGSHWKNVARIGAQVADALRYAHEQGLLHRDIKPANLLLSRNGRVWITDFGLAKAASDDDLTREGDLLGTWRYMAPEQFDGEATAQSDIYSLGLTLYELLTLQPAFQSRSSRRLSSGTQPLTRPSQHVAGVPRDLETIVLKAADPLSAARYATSGEMADDLRRFLADRPIAARRVPPWERIARWCRRNPVVAALSATTFLLLVSVALISRISAHRWRREHDKAIMAVEQAKTAERKERQALLQANRSLFRGYLTQSRYVRAEREAGRRFDSLKAICQARDLLPQMGLSRTEQRDRRALLRNETIVALTMADAEPADRFAIPRGTRSHARVGFDAGVERFAYQETDGRISIRRFSDGMLLTTLEGVGKKKPVRPYIVFSPDGKRLAVRGGEQGEPLRVRVWDISSKKMVVTRRCAGRYYHNDIAFSPDSSTIAIETEKGRLQLVDVDSGKTESEFTLPLGIYALSYAPNGRELAAACSGGQSEETPIYLIDVQEARVQPLFTHPNFVSSVAWSPNGEQLATACYDHNVYLWNRSTPTASPKILRGHGTKVRHVAFNRSNSLLMSYSWDSTTRWWDPQTGAFLFSAAVRGLQFSADGKWVGVEYPGEAAGRWRLAPGLISRTLHGHSNSSIVAAVAFGPQSDVLASAGTMDGVRFWNVQTSHPAEHVFQEPAYDIKFLSENQLLVATQNGFYLSELGRERVPKTIDRWSDYWNIALGRRKLLSNLPTRSIAVTRDGVLIASGTSVGRHFLFQHNSNEPPCRTSEWDIPEGISFTAISPNGEWVVYAVKQHPSIYARNTKTGETTLLPVGGSARLTFSPDGRYLVVGRFDGNTALEVGSWKKAFELETSAAGFGNVAFSRDMNLLAVVDFRKIRLLSFPDRVPLASLRVLDEEDLLSSFPEGAASPAFSKDGRWLAIGAGHGTLRLWDLHAVRRQLSKLQLDW